MSDLRKIAPRVIIVDPAHRVPFYDRSLSEALHRAGADVTFATAPLPYYDAPPHAPGVRVELRFGRAIGWLDGLGLDPASNAFLRRLARAIAYGPEMAGFGLSVVRAAAAGGGSWASRATTNAAPLIVHSQWSLAPRLDALVWRTLRRRGIPVVLTAHNVLPHELGLDRGHDRGVEHIHRLAGENDGDEATRARWRRLYASVDRVIVHSEATKRRLLSLGGISESALRVIPMPTETWPIGSAIDAEKPPVRPSRDAPLALFFGQIRPYKGLDILLDAWPEVVANLPEARLLVAGPISESGVERLRRDVEARGLGNQVELRLGYVPTADIADHFAAADVVVLPYIDTDDSAVLATAFGHGRATVASAVGGLPEALSRGGGMLVPPRDAPALAAALIEVLGNKAMRDRLEAEARAAAAVNSWDAAARATIDVYDELAEEYAVRAGRNALAVGRSTFGSSVLTPTSDSTPTSIATPTLTSTSAPILKSTPRPTLAPTSISTQTSTLTLTLPPPGDPLPAAPRVSVLMPARNAARHVAASIEGLLAGDWPADRLELIVAEGRSIDGTTNVIERIAAGDGRVRIVDNPAGETASGLNAALRAAAGDVIVRLDAHAMPAPDYVRMAVEALKVTGAWVVGGPMVGRGETAFGRAVARAQSTPLGSGGAAYRHGRAGPADTVYLGAWPRGVLDFVGGWDASLTRNQDAELCLRIREAGGLVYLDPSIQTVTFTRGTPIALALQYVGYGAGRAGTLVRHPRSLAWRQAMPAAFVAVLAVFGILAIWLLVSYSLARAAGGSNYPESTIALILGFVTMAYTATIGIAALIEAGATRSLSSTLNSADPKISRTRFLAVAGRIAIALAIMHIAWGVGFWSGLGRAVVRRLRHNDPTYVALGE